MANSVSSFSCCIRFSNTSSSYLQPPTNSQILISRRNAALSLTGAMLGLNAVDRRAEAAARRPPPSPPAERTDPNLSGVQAKVLASRKRKEAMKETMAKLRAQGKAADQKPPISE